MEIRTPKGRKFSSLIQLENAINQDLDMASKKVLENVAEEVKVVMEDLILEFYSQYSPDYYERTGQLLDAVRKAESKIYKTKEGWKIRIKVIDPEIIDSMWGVEGNRFNSYMSFSGQATYGGKRYTEWVVDWVDNGSDHGRVWGHDPIHFSEKINKLLDEKVKNGILKELKRAGFNWLK